MPVLDQYIVPVVLAFLASLFFVPLVKLIALRYNVVDNPNARKVHREPIPLLGGLGIYLAFVLVSIFFVRGMSNVNLKGILFSSLFIVALGFWDDRSGGITWRTKLIGQFLVAALVVFVFGVKIALFNIDILNIVVSLVWLAFITNSLNLLDNMDGLSGGIASIAAFFYGVLAHQSGQYDLALFSFILSAAALGFLKYNFSPASIFMGDLGSMFLGFTLGCIAIKLQVLELSNWQVIINHAYFTQYPWYWAVKNVVTSLVPLIVLGLPIFDTILVSVLRTLNGLAISTPGRDHSSHRLMQFKGSLQRKIDKMVVLFIRATGRRKKSQHHILRAMAHTRTVLILYACAGLLGGTALFMPLLTLKTGLIVFVLVMVIAFFSARKLNEAVVYKK